MRKLALLLLLLVFSVPASAAPITLTTGVRFEFSDCASGGSSAQTVQAGSYVFRLSSDADVYVCFAATCATGGELFPAGAMMHLKVPASTSVSCRSGGTGDVILTRGE